jgi:hypothetical protein
MGRPKGVRFCQIDDQLKKADKKVNKVVGEIDPIQGYLFRKLAGKFKLQ